MAAATPTKQSGRQISVLAPTSLAVTICGFIFLPAFAFGVVLAHSALRHISLERSRGRRLLGRGYAVVALWLGYGALATGLGSFVIMLLAVSAGS